MVAGRDCLAVIHTVACGQESGSHVCSALLTVCVPCRLESELSCWSCGQGNSGQVYSVRLFLVCVPWRRSLNPLVGDWHLNHGK